MKKRLVNPERYPTDTVETRHPLYETDSESRTKAFNILDSLTPTIREFLLREEPFVGDGIELNKADVAETNTVLRFYLIGGSTFDDRHTLVVRQKLPGFTLKTLFSPVHGANSGEGALSSGRMVLEYNIHQRFEWINQVWQGVMSVTLLGCFFAVIYCLRLFMIHTSEDTDPFGVIRRLWH